MNTFRLSAMALLVASCSTAFAGTQTQPAQAAQPNWTHGFYAGISAGLDSGRIRLKDNVPDYYYIPVRGASAGAHIGYTLMQSPQASAWQKGIGLEFGVNDSGANFKELNPPAALGIRSYTVKHDYSVSVLPMLDKNGHRFMARLGYIKTKLDHNEANTSPSTTAPAFTENLSGQLFGLGMGHALSPHWRWQAEWDEAWYPTVNKTNSGGNHFLQKMKRSLWRLSLSWYQMAQPMAQSSRIPLGWYGSLGAGQDRMVDENNAIFTGNHRHRDYALDGAALQFAAGYQFSMSQNFLLGTELSVTAMDSEMKFDNTVGSNDFTLGHPMTVAATLQPAWQFANGQAIYLEGGVGSVHVKKTGATNQGSGIQPNFDHWSEALVWGVGYRSMLDVSNGLNLHFQYVHSKLSKQITSGNAFKNRFTGPVLLISWEHHF